MSPLTPVAGVTRLRAFQLGIESTFKTQVPATRRMPWSVQNVVVDPHWTFPTGDTGTLDQAIAPYRQAEDITFQSVGELYANDAPTILSAGIMGGLSPATSGSSKSYTAAPASTSQDVFDTYTAEWFDDASGDAWAAVGGIIEHFTLQYPQDRGPIIATCDWRFAKHVYPATPTGSLAVDAAPVPLFFADTVIYLNDSSGTIETTALSDVFYDLNLDYQNNIDVKRFANGSNSRFEVASYGRGERVITLAANGAKQTGWIAEAVKWIGVNPTERFMGIKTQSVAFASAGVPYSFDVRLPGYWMTRQDQVVNTNTAFQLTLHQIYDTGLGYPIRVASVGTRASL